MAETAHFFSALLVWLKQFGGHTVVASMRLVFFDLPIYQPNATIHVAKYTSPMDGMGTVIDFMQRFDCFWCRHVVHKRVHLAWVLGRFCWGVESARSNPITVTFVCSM